MPNTFRPNDETEAAASWDSEKRSSPYSTVADLEDNYCESCDGDIVEVGPRAEQVCACDVVALLVASRERSALGDAREANEKRQDAYRLGREVGLDRDDVDHLYAHGCEA